MNNSLTNASYKTGIYIRLSQEDRNKKFVEDSSESVINQKTYLTNYANNNNLEIYDYYIDDGYTGTNFERPGFQRLIHDIESKKINTVLVKDFSRLGRDHIESGKYMDIYFPENNIRYISVQDNYDNYNMNGYDISTIMLSINDNYSRQNSHKITSVLNFKRHDGQFIGSRPSYGYMKDPNNKNKLIIDENVAKYVRLIFEMKSNNIGASEICTRLNNDKVPTPSAYKKIPKSSRLKNSETWTVSSIRKILQNEMYIGNMVQRKQAKPSYKSKKKRTLPKEEWIIVKNTHEPIIDEDIFRLVNQKSEKRERAVKLKTEREIRLLEGLLYCKECENKLGVTYRKHKDYWTVNCNKYARDPVRGQCTPHFFPYDKLERQVLKELDTLLSKLFSYVDINDLNNEIINNNNLNNDSIEIRKNKINREIIKINNSIKIAYQDRVDGNISIEDYKLIITPFHDQLNDLSNELNDIEIEIIKNKQNSIKIPDYTLNIKKLLNSSNPNRDLIHALLENIIVDKDRNITIKFKYDLLEKHTFKYVDDSPIRNPYGKKGKQSTK